MRSTLSGSRLHFRVSFSSKVGEEISEVKLYIMQYHIPLSHVVCHASSSSSLCGWLSYRYHLSLAPSLSMFIAIIVVIVIRIVIVVDNIFFTMMHQCSDTQLSVTTEWRSLTLSLTYSRTHSCNHARTHALAYARFFLSLSLSLSLSDCLSVSLSVSLSLHL